jgi:thioredoxin 1
MAASNVHTFTDENFQAEVVSSGSPVLVDFWAEWCQPCRLLAPTIDKIASEFTGKVKVGKVDIDTNQNVSIEYKISAIPTVLIFKDGKVHKKFVGMTGQGDLEAALRELVG